MARDITRELIRDQVQKEVARQTAIAELEHAAERWEKQAHEGVYTLAKDIRDYYAEKARSARHEAAVLRGEAVDEPAQVTKTTTVVLPR